ncbi:MAG: hypothetical protein ABFS05_12935, partial [Bacteroidota bacterium]
MANDAILEVLILAEELEYTRGQMLAHISISNMYASSGNYTDALHHIKLGTSLINKTEGVDRTYYHAVSSRLMSRI